MGNRVSHGESSPRVGKTVEYMRWESMLARCNNKNAGNWPRYGGRGISVCERWRSFERFLADMGRAPLGATLDRWPNNDGNYEPGNCRWATPKQQAENRRNNKRYSHNGESLILTEWSQRTGIKVATLRARITNGWSIERALTEPAKLLAISNSLKRRLLNRIYQARYLAKRKAKHDLQSTSGRTGSFDPDGHGHVS